MFKKLYKELQKELFAVHHKAHMARWAKDLETNKAKLAYEKFQLIKKRQPHAEVESKLKALESGKVEIPPLDNVKVRQMAGNEDDVHNLQNVVTYLKAHREYNELFERYHRVSSMTQEENVRKSANLVGLKVPEN